MTQEVKPSKGIWLTNGLLIGEIAALIAAFTLVQIQLQGQTTRTDNLNKEFTSLLKTQVDHANKFSERTDKLYDEFILLIKEKNK